MNLESLRKDCQLNAVEEDELLVDPKFFEELIHIYSEITNVEVQLKRGWPLNELTKFRYDVFIRLNGEQAAEDDPELLEWNDEKVTLTFLK